MPQDTIADRPLLPEWQVSTWLGTPEPITLASLRGRVVLLHTFQMLCPGCVAYGLPQAERVRRWFAESEVAVVGLHTVFEHHAAMSVQALRAFVHEYRWSFPIGVDEADGADGIPRTMARYGLRGTPTHLVLDHEGRVALHHFGQMDDLALGDVLGRLVAQAGIDRAAAARIGHGASVEPGACLPDGCEGAAPARA